MKQREVIDDAVLKQKNLLPSDSLRNTLGLDFTLATRRLKNKIELFGGLLVGGAYLLFGALGMIACVGAHLVTRTMESLFIGIGGLLVSALFFTSGWKILANVVRSWPEKTR